MKSDENGKKMPAMKPDSNHKEKIKLAKNRQLRPNSQAIARTITRMTNARKVGNEANV